MGKTKRIVADMLLMTRIKRTFCIGMTLLVMFGTVSCGTAPQADHALEVPENAYSAEREVVVDIDEAVLSNCYVTEQYIYYIQAGNGGGNGIWMRELAAEAEPVCVCSFADDEFLLAFTVTGAGNVIAAVKDKEQGSIWLRKTDKNGEVIWESDFPERQDGLIISHMLVGSDGRIYVSSQQELFFWNVSGEFERRLTVRGKLIQYLTDAGEGKVCVIQYKQKGQMLTVYQGTDGKEVFQKDFKEERRWFGDGSYYSEINTLVRYHWDSDSSEAVINFTDCGIDISSIRIFRTLEEDRFLVGLVEEESPGIRFVWLTAADKEWQQPKTQLVVATFNPQNLQNGIVRFNRSHENYELVTKVFDSNLSVVLNQRDRFNIYIASGSGPDIIDIFGETDYFTYARDGYLLDLTPFIEKSEKINMDDFLPRVLEDMSVDGKLYTVPRTMALYALTCPTELLEGKTSWTIEEYLDLLEQYPNAMSGDGASIERVKSNILRTALQEGINGFIDWEAGKALFDGEEFRTILKRIDGLEVAEISRSRKEMAQDGEVVFRELYVNRANELLYAEWISRQELTMIGYPVSGKEEGEKSRNHISYGDMMGIHSASKETAAAWDFVEEYMTGAIRKSDYMIRTGKEAFEEKMQEDIGVESLTLDGHLPPLTQEEADEIRNAFMEASYASDSKKPLLDIIGEETKPYFRGEKELDDVVGIIQNRIQVYLNERR